MRFWHFLRVRVCHLHKLHCGDLFELRYQLYLRQLLSQLFLVSRLKHLALSAAALSRLHTQLVRDVSNEGEATCRQCDPGTSSTAGQSLCTNCSSGFFSSGSTGFFCAPCGDGFSAYVSPDSRDTAHAVLDIIYCIRDTVFLDLPLVRFATRAKPLRQDPPNAWTAPQAFILPEPALKDGALAAPAELSRKSFMRDLSFAHGASFHLRG